FQAIREKPKRKNRAMGQRNVMNVEVIGVSRQEASNGKFLDEPREDSRKAPLPIEYPFIRNCSQLRQKILIALDRARDHRGKKQNERHVFAHGSSFCFVSVAVPGIV